LGKFSNISHLLFSHDGVLVDTEFWYFKAIQDELRGRGIEFSLDEYMDHMITGRSVHSTLLNDSQHDAFQKARNRRYEGLLQFEDIQIPGAENTLAILHDRFPMAMVTTSSREHFELIHEHRNIKGYFQFVLSPLDYERAKPAPDLYLAAIDRFGIQPEQALIIEDGTRGLESAIAANIPCVIVKNDFAVDKDFSGAAAYIETLTELPQLLGLRMPGIHRD
jgi:HAD superfamily hydrolase (TIGR01509 family)